MPVTHYPAIIERGEHGFGVFFPDLPGCTSAGSTVQEAALNAEEALRGHLAAMADDGDKIPDPTDIDKLERDPDVNEAARLLVRADLPGKSVRLNISMDEGLVEAMDSRAKMRGVSRSAYLADLVRGDLIGERQTAASAEQPQAKFTPVVGGRRGDEKVFRDLLVWSFLEEFDQLNKESQTSFFQTKFETDANLFISSLENWIAARGAAVAPILKHEVQKHLAPPLADRFFLFVANLLKEAKPREQHVRESVRRAE